MESPCKQCKPEFMGDDEITEKYSKRRGTHNVVYLLWQFSTEVDASGEKHQVQTLRAIPKTPSSANRFKRILERRLERRNQSKSIDVFFRVDEALTDHLFAYREVKQLTEGKLNVVK